MALYYRISPWLVPPLVVPMLVVLLIAATRRVDFGMSAGWSLSE